MILVRTLDVGLQVHICPVIRSSSRNATMARYTNFFMTGSAQEDINRLLVSALENCDLNLIYQDSVFIVAKEKSGSVSFAQLATVELHISPPTIENGGSKIDLVVKNEELPLRAQNHCREVFSKVNQAIAEANSESNSESIAS